MVGVMGQIQPYVQPQAPAYGLRGANQALSMGTGPQRAPAYGLAGANQALSINSMQRPVQSGNPIDYNRNLAMHQGQSGINAVNGYVEPGIQAQQMQAALSGTLGQGAQQEAYNNFQSSPGQQWLQQQAERGLLRNQAAIGGLGGGNIRQELQRQAMGMAQQDFQNQFNNIGSVADRGMQGSQLQNNLYNMMGGAATSAGAQHAGLIGAQIGADASLSNAGLAAGTALARDKAQYAFNAGTGLSANIGGTTSALANLQNQGGINQSNLMGSGSSNLATLLQGGGLNAGASQESLASILAGLQTGQAQAQSQLPSVGQFVQPNAFMTNAGNALQAAGGAMQAYNGYQASQANQLQPFSTSQYAGMYRT